MTTAQITNHEEVLSSLIVDCCGVATAPDLAKRLAVSTSTARRYLAELEQRGWVRSGMVAPRKPGTGRGRREYAPTERGRTAYRECEGW